MIGNDIIDIDFTRKYSDWKRRGFLAKVFTKSEQDYITQSIDPFHGVWRFWSMKESAYKLHLRSKQVRSFYPSKLSCKLLDDIKGMVFIEGESYNTTTKKSKDYIFTFTTQNKLLEVAHDIIMFDEKLPVDYYALIQNEISLHLDCRNTEINIIKNTSGIPQLYRNKIKLEANISITHHGKYLAWSLAM